MSNIESDVVILGAGAAGLSAGRALAGNGLRITILEARDRIGGRVHTIHDAASPLPIELGAEFLHGKDPETFRIVQEAPLAVYEITGEHWHAAGAGGFTKLEDFWATIESPATRMARFAARGERDRTFAEFLRSLRRKGRRPTRAEELYAAFVEGFNAAEPARISVRGLAESEEQSEKIE